MSGKRYTPENITTLNSFEVFVFGSNLAGVHCGGAAKQAFEHFGAIWGQGSGMQGSSYAIPTMQGGVETIKPYVDQFVQYASSHKEFTFLVTRIGCGIAGFRDEEIAPMFLEALELENVVLPKEFVDILNPLKEEQRRKTISKRLSDIIKKFNEKQNTIEERKLSFTSIEELIKEKQEE